MTTRSLIIDFALSTFCRHCVSQEKQCFWTIALSAPMPNSLKNANLIFLVISPSLRDNKAILSLGAKHSLAGASPAPAHPTDAC